MTDVKCKILFILSSLCIGGAEKHVVSLINQLDNRYFELHLCYLKDNTSLVPQIKKEKLNGLFCGEVKKKIDFTSGRLLASYVEKQEIDIIVSTNMYPMIYAALAKFLSKRHPLMVDVLHSTHLESLRDKLEMLFYRSFFRAQNQLIYVSDNQRSYWQQQSLQAQNECVIHNGIDTAYFSDSYSIEEKLNIRQSYGFSEKDYLIGICAVLRPEKKHVDLLKALKNLQIKGIMAKCLIIGDGDERDNIEQQIADLDLKSQVKITGFQQDIRPLIASCDVMAIVSYTETFSIAALEAMSLGKPMIMSDVGGATEQVAEGINGCLFPVGDIKSLETALIQLGDNKTRLAFGKRSREIVLNNFTQEKMVNGFHKLFLDLKMQH